MMHLSTKFVSEQNEKFVFHWSTGSHKCGVLHVEINKPTTSPRFAAELRAIEYLIFEKNIFQREIILSGKGFHFHVSQSPVLDLCRKKKTKDSLMTRLLQVHGSRLFGCLLSLIDDNQQSFLENVTDSTPIENIGLARIDFSCIETPVMGKVRISQHSIEQYKSRLKTGSPVDPLRSITKRLLHPNIQRQEIPKYLHFRKKLTHGVTRTDEHWGHQNDDVHFVVVREPDTGIGNLVTTYVRLPQYMAS